jgi:hypothetical protein
MYPLQSCSKIEQHIACLNAPVGQSIHVNGKAFSRLLHVAVTAAAAAARRAFHLLQVARSS